MRTRIRSLTYLTIASVIVAGPAFAQPGPTLRLGDRMYPIEDPQKFGDWVRDVERTAGDRQQEYSPAGATATRDPSTGLPTGKRVHKPILARGSVSVTVPSGLCTPGARYPSATLASDEQTYELSDVTVASCSPEPSDVAEKKKKGGQRPSETMTLNFTKLEFKNVSSDRPPGALADLTALGPVHRD